MKADFAIFTWGTTEPNSQWCFNCFSKQIIYFINFILPGISSQKEMELKVWLIGVIIPAAWITGGQEWASNVPIFEHKLERLRTTFFNSTNVKMRVLRHELLCELNAKSRQNYCRN